MIIIQDTREKEPWNFIHYDTCKGQEIKKLDCGDYTLHDIPDLIIIERKKSTSEITINLGIKYKQFVSEFEKMQRYRFRYVICEFTMEELLKFPLGSGIPKSKWKSLKMTGRFLMHRVNELSDDYGVEFIFCGNREAAREKTMELLLEAKDIYEEEYNR